MKKLLLFISTVIGLSSTNAQNSFELNNNSAGGLITNNSVITEDVVAPGQSHIYVQLKNISSGAKTYAMRRTDIILNPGSDAYFCWGGQCYPPNITMTPVSNYVTLNPNQSDTPQPFYLDENVADGYSEIKYEVFDVNNPTDILTFTVKYNPSLAVTSIKNNASLFSSVSGVYPNPVESKARITVSSTKTINDAKVSIMNALGCIVSTKTVELAQGKNTIELDTENLNAGIYFATISSNNTKAVKKFTVNK